MESGSLSEHGYSLPTSQTQSWQSEHICPWTPLYRAEVSARFVAFSYLVPSYEKKKRQFLTFRCTPAEMHPIRPKPWWRVWIRAEGTHQNVATKIKHSTHAFLFRSLAWHHTHWNQTAHKIATRNTNPRHILNRSSFLQGLKSHINFINSEL